jgi:putative acetyltransferase
MNTGDLQIRRAEESDVDVIAVAHRDSIRSIGSRFYPPAVVDDWEEGVTGEIYLGAMRRGEVFFIASARIDDTAVVLGFASDYPIEGTRYGTSVYVRGAAARRGIGSRLLALAEADAVSRGATSLHIEASLAGVDFYSANGFVEVSRGDTHLQSGRPIACVFMRKDVGR